MSRKALRDELMTLLVAGQETSAILLGWACAFLAQHPDVQQRAAEEAQQVAFRGTAATVADVITLQDLLWEPYVRKLAAVSAHACDVKHVPRHSTMHFPRNITGMLYGMQGS